MTEISASALVQRSTISLPGLYLGIVAKQLLTTDSTLMLILRQVLPNSIDWRTRGVVTGVQNQVCSCMCPILHLTLFYKFREASNSCWAFAASGAMEGQYAISRGREHLVSLSAQQLVDCSGELSAA